MTNELELVIKESGVEETTAVALQNSFTPFLLQAKEWEIKALALVVTDVSQTAEMKMAREGRLALKNIRVAADHKRVELKENSLRYGKAVQDVYNKIEGLIKPIEKHLEVQEKFAEVQEAKRKAELSALREEELKQFGDFAPLGLDLGELTDNAYQTLVAGIKAQIQAKIDADRLAEEQRIAYEKQERTKAERREKMFSLGLRFNGSEFQYKDINFHWTDLICMSDEQFDKSYEGAKARKEQIDEEKKAELLRLNAEIAEREKILQSERAKAEAERKAAEEAARKEREIAAAKLKAEQEKAKSIKAANDKLQAEIRAKAEAEAIAKRDEEFRIAAELRHKEEAERKAKAAPDKEKLIAFSASIALLDEPELSTEAANEILSNAKGLLFKVRKYIQEKTEQL